MRKPPQENLNTSSGIPLNKTAEDQHQNRENMNSAPTESPRLYGTPNEYQKRLELQKNLYRPITKPGSKKDFFSSKSEFTNVVKSR